MIEKVLWEVVFIWVIILPLGWAKNRIPSLYPLLRLNTSLPIAIAPNFCGCKNSSLIMVFVKNVLPSIMTIPVLLTSLRILFNILKQNIERFDTTSFRSLSKMVLSLLSSFTLMIRRLICSLSLSIANSLNSYAKTLVWSPWSDIFSFCPFLMHLHLVLWYVMINMFLFVCFQFCSVLFFIQNLIFFFEKSEKYKNSVCFVYIGTYVP